jgi:transposase
LDAEQERELRRRAAAYSGPWRDVVRARAILMAAEGLSNAVIAERLGVARQSVSEWRKRFFEEGVAGLEERPRPGRPRSFSPGAGRRDQGAGVRAAQRDGVPLSRWSSAEIAREAVKRGIVAEISGATVWRWLGEDAIRPWSYRSWIFPRDPNFAAKAGPILDLYEGRWQGQLLEPGDFVICADEKPSIQARRRKAPTLPATRHAGQRVEHEYERQGALCYLAAWDARRAKIFDRCAPKDGIAPFDALVEQFMSVSPYTRAQRVFLVVDNGSAHRGQRSVDRLQSAWRTRSSCTPRSTRPGSTRPRSTSPSPNARCSSPTTSPTSTCSSSGCSRSPATTSRSQPRSSGSSPATTSTACSHDWTAAPNTGSRFAPHDRHAIRQDDQTSKNFAAGRAALSDRPPKTPGTCEWDH